MATARDTKKVDFDEKLTVLQSKIVETFEKLFQALEKRKQELLSRLSAIKVAHYNNLEIDEAIKQLRIAKEKAISAMTSNLLEGIVDPIKAGFEYNIRLKEMKKESVENVNFIEFRCLSEQIIKGIEETDLVELIPEYIGRENPILQKCALGRSKAVLQNARGIAIDRTTNEIYIADHSNNRIQVMSTDGDFIRGFAHGMMLALHAICLSKKEVFVTDKRNYLLKFSKAGKFLKQTGSRGNIPGQFVAITGMCYENGFVYVCDSSLQWVQVFDSDLIFSKTFGYGNIASPTAINIHSNTIFILSEDQNEIYSFSKGYRFLKKIPFAGQKNLMAGAEYFTIDSKGNFLVCDCDYSEIRIFSPNGYLKHTLGRGHLKFLGGVVLDNENAVICVNFGEQRNCFQKY